MRNRCYLLVITIFFTLNCIAQTYIEPVAGFQADVANGLKFQQVNTGVQVSFKQSREYELIVRVQKSSGLSLHRNDSAFTANTSLPLYEKAAKTIHPGAWYFSVDHRFILKSDDKKYQFSLLLHTGFTSQKLTVNYQYDKSNYTILNPDQTQKKTSLFIGAGAEYMWLMKDNRLFVQLTIDSPPLHSKNGYPNSFSFIAPLAFIAGYSVLIKKKKHDK